jgi:peptidoglycan hydrolase CwlO-like protein
MQFRSLFISVSSILMLTILWSNSALAQSKKEQIELLTQTSDSLRLVLASERATCITEKSELNTQITQHKSEIQKSGEANQNLTKTVAEKEASIQSLKTEQESLQGQITQLKTLLSQAQAAIDAGKEENTKLEEKAKTLGSQALLKSDSISQLSQTISTLKGQLTAHQNSIDKLNGSLKQKVDSINALSSEIKKLNTNQSSPTADFSSGKTKENFNSLKQKLVEIMGKENKNAIKIAHARLDGIYGVYATSLADSYEFALESGEGNNENSIDIKLSSPNSYWLQIAFIEHYTDPMGREESMTSSILINKANGASRTWDSAIQDGKGAQLISIFNKQLNLKKSTIKACGIPGEEVFNMRFEETDISRIIFSNGNLELTYFVSPESYGPCNQTITVPWIDAKGFFNL